MLKKSLNIKQGFLFWSKTGALINVIDVYSPHLVYKQMPYVSKMGDAPLKYKPQHGIIFNLYNLFINICNCVNMTRSNIFQ